MISYVSQLRWLTGLEAAVALNRHPVLIYRWLSDGRIRGRKFGRTWMVSERELTRFKRTQPQRRKRKGSKK
jgi:excisionase family DNA binding protein